MYLRSCWFRCYWFEVSTLTVGLATAAAVLQHGSEAVFSVAALTAAALSAGTFTVRRRVLA